MWWLRSLVIICLNFNHLFISTMGDPTIVIIGAGLSGISVASKLLENGYENITILEAEDRIGGRIHSIPFGDKFIDLGGQWVHGQSGNAIYKLAKGTFDFGSSDFDETYMTYVLSNGSFADKRKCRKLADLAEQIVQQSEDEEYYEGSMGEYFPEKFKRRLNDSQYSNVEPKLADQMIDNVQKELNSYYASSSWYDISVKVNANYDYAEGNQHLTWKDKGFKTAIDYITKKLPNPSKYLNVESKIHLKKEVTDIQWQNPDGNVQLKCADGTTFSADHVIFTASLGVLKNRHEKLFSPKLPSRKISAIDNLGFGAIGKIFLEFEKPFWSKLKDPFIGYSFLWQDEHKTEAKSSNREWLLGVAGFYSVDAFPNLIEAFVSGPDMRAFESLTDQNLTDDCMWLLEKFLGEPLAQPTQMIRTKWLTNNNFLGTYSYLSMNTQTFNVTPGNLAESLKSSNGKPIILFAGEATDLKYPSYAHGAVSSGWRAAGELVNYYKDAKQIVN